MQVKSTIWVHDSDDDKDDKTIHQTAPDVLDAIIRDCHRYGKTCGFSETGGTGMGTVVGGFWHTTTYHGYFTGIFQQGECNFYCFKTCFFWYLIIVFSLCHTMMQTQLCILTIKQLSPYSHSHPTSRNQVSHSSIYILKTDQWFILRLIIYVLKVSYRIPMQLLTMYISDADTKNEGAVRTRASQPS